MWDACVDDAGKPAHYNLKKAKKTISNVSNGNIHYGYTETELRENVADAEAICTHNFKWTMRLKTKKRGRITPVSYCHEGYPNIRAEDNSGSEDMRSWTSHQSMVVYTWEQ